jgi:hypothetical protein
VTLVNGRQTGGPDVSSGSSTSVGSLRQACRASCIGDALMISDRMRMSLQWCLVEVCSYTRYRRRSQRL